MKLMISTLAVFGLLFLASCSGRNIREPEYRDIENIHLIQPGLLQSTAGFDLIYYNPNNFGVQLTDARGDVYVDNFYLGRFELAEPISVRRRSEFIVPAIVKIDMIGAVKNQRELYKKKEATIRIDGIARMKKTGIPIEVPIKYQSVQNIEKLRSLITGQ